MIIIAPPSVNQKDLKAAVRKVLQFVASGSFEYDGKKRISC